MPTVWNNVPVAYIDPNFASQLSELKEHCRRIYTATLIGADSEGSCGSSPDNQRQWQMPVPNGWDLNLFNITDIGLAFDRAVLNKVYIRALNKTEPVGTLDKAPIGEGRVADCMALKIMIDYLAVMERAFRLRHSSTIRCSIHAAVRRRGHSTWNDAVGAAATLNDLGGGAAPEADDVAGPVGGIFTTMLRYLMLIIKGGYNEGPVDIVRPETVIVVLADGTVEAVIE